MKKQRVLDKAEKILQKVEKLLNTYHNDDELNEDSVAWIWNKVNRNGFLEAIELSDEDALDNLHYIDRQKTVLKRNTLQFLAGYPANNALLWGPRGTGKSSLIRAILNEFSASGLKMIEVQPKDMADIPVIMKKITNLKGKFVIFCDDLTFENNETDYKILKTVLDGSIRVEKQFIVYATSNRRHIVPEDAAENFKGQIINNELHHSEAIEEKISLSERFGIWLSFHPFSQDDYVNIATSHLKKMACRALLTDELEEIRTSALRWSLERGSRSGRVAYQFALDWLGKKRLGKNE